MPEKNINSFLISVYSDSRMTDEWRAYLYTDDEDEARNAIPSNEVAMAIDDHYDNWCCEFSDDDDNDELEEWEACIDLHVRLLTDELNNKDYMNWFENLPCLYDERNK